MSLIPESMSSAASRLRHRANVAPPPPPGARQLFEPEFLNHGERGGGEERFYPTTDIGIDHEEDRTSVLSKWEDLDSGRIDRSVPAPSAVANRGCDDEGDDDDDDFHEMQPATMVS